MSEERIEIFHPSFNRSILVDSVDNSLSANAGAILLREADHNSASRLISQNYFMTPAIQIGSATST